MRLSNYHQAKAFKNQLPDINITADYDRNIWRLVQNEQDQLQSVYEMFDSIAVKQQLGAMRFANMIVSFVQHIPYTLILPYDCDANLYRNEFVRKYLHLADARCQGYERFGISSPVEFLTNLKGDCDSRTLLLYTILNHYQYDVVMLSSEYYGHALLGVKLPYGGFTFPASSGVYTMWETTARYPAGAIAPQMQQINHWRICLNNTQYELQ